MQLIHYFELAVKMLLKLIKLQFLGFLGSGLHISF